LVEIFERMSYYGMASLLVLYMSEVITAGGLGFSEGTAKMLFAVYTGSVYLTPLLGGLIADRWLGARRTMLLGGIIIAVGHLLVAFQWQPSFFFGLAVIALGTGLLKPNVNTMVGALYAPNDPRRNAGFNLVYMGINIGAAAAPIICGTMAQSPWFKGCLASMGFDPLHSWHWGFAAAGVGMCFGLLQYWLHRERLSKYGERPARQPQGNLAQAPHAAITRQEWHKLAALAFLFIAFTLYCGVSQQAGTSLMLFAKNLTQLSIGEWHFEASHTNALNPLFIIALTPVFAWLWTTLNKRKAEPSEPLKFSFGMVFLALGTMLMVPASWAAGKDVGSDGLVIQNLASPWWLVGVYFFQTVAELFMSPVGNAAATRLAPSRFASLTMGVWYTSVGFGSFLGGWLSGMCDTSRPESFAVLFGIMTVGSLALAGILYALTPRVKRLMLDVPAQPAGAHA